MEEILDQFLVFIFEELKNAKLKPHLFEYEVGDEKSPFELTGSDNKDEHILVSGFIDRIDVDPEKRFAIIVDYKLSKHVKPKDTELGLVLQLPLYALAVEKNMNVKVIGAYLFRLSNLKTGESVKWGFFSDEGLKDAGFGEAKSAERKALGASSRNTYSENEFRQRVGQSAEWAKKYTKDIRKGKFPVYPKDCLKYCKFKSVCRIENWMKDQIQYELAEGSPS
jgi:ATP-dependent helicase/DNAse subunit B